MKRFFRQRQQQPNPSFNTFILEPILTPSGLVDAPGDDTPDPSLLSDLFNDLDGDDLTDTPNDFDPGFDEEIEVVSFFNDETPESPFNAGVFTVDESGQVGIDFLYDGGGYKGELAIFSLEGMEDFEPGSEEFIKEAADRALSNSELGHIVIQDASEGAKFEGKTAWEANFNGGDYKGVKTVEMNPGDTFGVMLVPRGTVQQVFDNPDIGGATRPLFSMQTINPNDAFHVGQIADVTGDGNTFVMEDLRVDGWTDQDYNDIIFQVRGATAEASHIDDVIDADRDWRFNDTGKALIEYAKAYVEPPSEAFEAPDVPRTNQPLVGFIDTGLNEGNPDLDYDNITLGHDFVGKDSNPLLASGEGNEHGTHIVGIVAAQSDNNIGIDGINEDAPLWVGRAVGSGKWSESLIEFVDAAKDSGQPNAVVNLSMDLIQIDADNNETTRYELTPNERAAIEYARQHNVLIVASAGNDGGVMSALGQASQEFDNIITVGAAEQFDLLKSSWQGADRADYSSYGYGLDIMAYGGTPDNPEISLTEDNIGTLAGTSVATAKVTGAVSQVWAANPDLNYRQVIELLKKTATDLGDTDFDTETGAGLLNIAAAIHLAKTTKPEEHYAPSSSIPLTWSGEGIYTPSERAVAVATPGQQQQYIVKPGDTLWGIAQRLLGNSNRWREIMKSPNGGTFTDAEARRLRVGQSIYLPVKQQVGTGKPVTTPPRNTPVKHTNINIKPGATNVNFTRGQEWVTTTNYKFRFQHDGNLVLYNPQGKAVWATGTDRTSADLFSVQADGNVVLYDRGVPVWATNTDKNPGAYLSIQADGNVVVYAANNKPLYATNTNIGKVGTFSASQSWLNLYKPINKPGYVNGNVGGGSLNFRSSPKLNAAVMGKLAKGTSMTILQKMTGDTYSGRNDWYKVKVGNRIGFVAGYYITEGGGNSGGGSGDTGAYATRRNQFFNSIVGTRNIERRDTPYYKGQCVSLAARYVQDVYLPAHERSKTVTYGNGKDTARVVSEKFSKYFEPATSSGLPKRGAIISFPDLGNIGGVNYGHVAVVTESRQLSNGQRQVKIMDSNGTQGKVVKQHSYWINVPDGRSNGYGRGIYWTNPRQ